MEVQSSTGFWWLKSSKSADHLKLDLAEQEENHVTSTPKETDDTPTISSSLKEFLEKERALQTPEDGEADIGSIIDEINKLAAQSPLGPYDEDVGERSVEELMREAEKIYMESSKSFEQLSTRSKTSANLSLSFNESAKSTPTPKSASPLPLDSEKVEKDLADTEHVPVNVESYTDDFTQESTEKQSQPKKDEAFEESQQILEATHERGVPEISTYVEITEHNSSLLQDKIAEIEEDFPSLDNHNKLVKEDSNEGRRDSSVSPVAISNPRFNADMEKLLEQLKDSEETNTALRLQLDSLNEAHQLLKIAYDELLSSNKQLEERASRVESELLKCEEALRHAENQRDKLIENEKNLEKLLETEKLRAGTAKLQNEKDARCISDLNRQVKEMERIIARKHPDSVSALIVAAKDDRTENNVTARKLLEDRIKSLENEVVQRDRQSSKVFLEVQEKFDEMKKKYESHIEDLELHVNDLKDQLKRRNDTFDMYTQTFIDGQKIPSKETRDASVQTSKLQQPSLIQKPVIKKSEKSDGKEDAHLLATIRGLQADLVNKEKVTAKLQRELEEVKKTNKRLQKEREGNLKNLMDGKNFQAGYAEKIAYMRVQNEDNANSNVDVEEEIRLIRTERDKMKLQLCRLEEDYQNLKAKRLYDLSTLQRAHEEEMSAYVKSIESLQEQMKIQQITITNLQDQLLQSRFPPRIDTTENGREHEDFNSNRETDLNKQITSVEQKEHEMEWCRLTAILQGLSQKNTSGRGCQQCVTRQKELVRYKTELDQLLSTLRKLT